MVGGAVIDAGSGNVARSADGNIVFPEQDSLAPDRSSGSPCQK
jgi:hypothetical protein